MPTKELNDFGHLKIHPNPADNDVNIDIENFSDLSHLKVYDIVGNCVLNQNLLKVRNQNIDVSKLINGTYSVVFNFNNGSITKKIVIVR